MKPIISVLLFTVSFHSSINQALKFSKKRKKMAAVQIFVLFCSVLFSLTAAVPSLPVELDNEHSLHTSVYGFGKCHNDQVKVMDNFVPSQYDGTWYEIGRLDSAEELFSKCGFGYYNFDAVNNRVNVTQHAIRGARWINITGIATAPDAKVPAKLQVQFSFQKNTKGMYWILDTDYKTYSVVHACVEFGPLRAKYAWLLSRTAIPHFDVPTTDKVRATLASVKVDLDDMTMTNQKDCPY